MNDATSTTPPGPDGLPVLGSTLSILRDRLGFAERSVAEYGDVVTATVAGDRYTMVAHPEHVERVLVTDADLFETAETTRRTFGGLAPNALLLQDGEEWRWLRRLLQPAFTRERIETYADVMARTAAEHATGWEDDTELDVQRAMREVTVTVLARALFGVDVGDRRDRIRHASRAINRRFSASNPSVFLPDWVPTPTNRRFRRATSDLGALVDDLVRERRGNPGEYDDLLALLLTAEQDDEQMDHETFVDNVIGFLLAGQDTTATALSFTLFSLATTPAAQSRVHAELEDVLDGRRPTAGDLFDLEYTTAAIKEGMRLYPPAFSILRDATEDVEIGGYTVPAGSTVSLSQWVVHRDGRWWDDPETYRPERWLVDDPERPEYAYFPFGGGPRHCLGMRFATTEMKLVLAVLLQRFELLPVTTDVSVAGGLSLSTSEPIEVRTRRR